MSGDSIHVQREVRLRALMGRASAVEALRDQLQENVVSTEAEIEHLSHEVVLLAKVEELFRALVDQMVMKQVKVIEEIVTEGFQTIFFDQDLHFEAEVGAKYNKVSIDFFVREGSLENPIVIRGKPLEGFGGGPSSIASLILRILALFRLQRFPLLLLDETLAAVSDEYVDGTGQWLRAMAAQMGVPILLITHKFAFTEHADLAYRCTPEFGERGQKCLALKTLDVSAPVRRISDEKSGSN